MLYNVSVAELSIGSDIEGFYLLQSAQQKTTSAGSYFLSGKISDRTGAVDFKVWDYNGVFNSQDEGTVVKVRGKVGEYKGTPQVTVTKIRKAQDGDEYDLSELVPVAPIDVERAMMSVRDMIAGIQDPGMRELCDRIMAQYGSYFERVPAAKTVHHAFVSGLLMHTHQMMVNAMFLAEQYRDFVNMDLMIAGTFLHDIGKLQEFACTELGLVSDYTVEGHLLGHLYLGSTMIDRLCDECGVGEEDKMMLQHMLLSHHGEPEFGACVVPQTAEAELLSHIDMLDSKMEQYREALEKTAPGKFSDKVWGLGKAVYRSIRGV